MLSDIRMGGTVKRDPVRKLLPTCSATLMCRVRIVEPTYSDAQRAQLNLYTREDRIANGCLSLKLKNKPILKLLTKIMSKSTSGKNLCKRIESSDFIFSDCAPK